MGRYLNDPEMPIQGKADWLIQNAGAIEMVLPPTPADVTSGFEDDRCYVCVVENALFDAAGVVYDEDELARMTAPDSRLQRWLVMDVKQALPMVGD